MHESEKWKWSHSVVSDPQRPHGLQPTRLLRPWDFPGKSTAVGCHTCKMKMASIFQRAIIYEGHCFLKFSSPLQTSDNFIKSSKLTFITFPKHRIHRCHNFEWFLCFEGYTDSLEDYLEFCDNIFMRNMLLFWLGLPYMPISLQLSCSAVNTSPANKYMFPLQPTT